MPTIVNPRAAVGAGLIAGAIFLALEMILVGTVGGGSPWAPPRMIAAIVLGSEVLPPPATFDLFIVLVAAAVHFALSVVFGLLLGWAISRWRLALATAALAGLAFGLAVYVLDFYAMTFLFPWFAMARNTISIVAHAVFGLALGAAYRVLAGPPRTALAD